MSMETSVRPQMVDFGSGQGRNDFAAAGVAWCYVERAWLATPLLQKSENAGLGQKMPFVDEH